MTPGFRQRLQPVWSLAEHRQTWRRAILRFKENNDQVLSQRLAHILWENLPPSLEIEALVGIPSSGRRQRWRGYSGPQRLAQILAQKLGIPSLNCLSVPGDPLARKHLRHRHQQAPEFVVTGRVPARLLLLDDVVTSGQTLLQACLRLQEAGAQHVMACSLAASVDN